MKKLNCLVIFVSALMQTAFGQLVFETKAVERTAAWDDQELIAEFKFRNAGTSAVKILSVKPSCDCTIAALEKNTIAAGEAGVMKVTFKIGDRRGTQIKSIAVLTDDKAHSDAILRFVARIPEPVRLEPVFLFWSVGEKSLPKQIKVLSASSIPIHAKRVTSSNTAFKSSLETVKDGSEYLITVYPADTNSRQKTELQVETDLTAPKWRVVTAYAQVK